MTDNRGRIEVAAFSGIFVKVFEKRACFQGIAHVIQSGDTIALNTRDIDDLIIALVKAKQAIEAQ